MCGLSVHAISSWLEKAVSHVGCDVWGDMRIRASTHDWDVRFGAMSMPNVRANRSVRGNVSTQLCVSSPQFSLSWRLLKECSFTMDGLVGIWWLAKVIVVGYVLWGVDEQSWSEGMTWGAESRHMHVSLRWRELHRTHVLCIPAALHSSCLWQNQWTTFQIAKCGTEVVSKRVSDTNSHQYCWQLTAPIRELLQISRISHSLHSDSIIETVWCLDQTSEHVSEVA